MTENEFNLGLMAEPLHTADGRTRVRYLVAAALSERAMERAAEGRPDVAGRLRWAAYRLDGGQYITKRVLRLLDKDIQIVRARLVDGRSIAGR